MARKALLSKKVIVRAAFFLFKQKGIDSFRMRNIAKVLNSSTTPIYYHFSSSEELKNEMVEEIIKLFLDPVKDLEDYYTYENLTMAFCLFAKNHRKLFEAIFIRSSVNSGNCIRDKVFKFLRKIIEQDKTFDYHRDYYKLLLGDGLALKVFTNYHKMTEEEVRELVKEYLLHMFA